MARQETGESSNLLRTSRPPLGAEKRLPDPHAAIDNSLVPTDIDLWKRSLVTGWLEESCESDSDLFDTDLFLLFQGHRLKQFEDCLDGKLATLEEEKKLPLRRPGEDYPIEYLPLIVRAYDDASAEVGWDPLTRISGATRDTN